jgi:hypothetical protein
LSADNINIKLERAAIFLGGELGKPENMYQLIEETMAGMVDTKKNEGGIK